MGVNLLKITFKRVNLLLYIKKIKLVIKFTLLNETNKEEYIYMEADFMKNIVRVRRGIIAFILLAVIFVLPSYASEAIGKKDKKLPKSVQLNGVELGGKTLEEVKEFIDGKVNQLENKDVKISFTYKGENQVHSFKLKDLGYYSNKDEVKKEISLLLYNDLNPLEKIKEYVDIKKNGRRYTLTHRMDYEKFCKALNIFDVSKLPKPISAKYEYKNGRVIIIPEAYGYELDKEKLYNQISCNVTEEQKEFTLYYKIWRPKTTKEILEKQGIKGKIASFTTAFNSNNKPRSKNIRLAASIINGTIVAPGEVFSFNKVVGQRTRARGFEEAGVYINGNLDEGLGGGICQVSTTLYNAVLLADLEVVERDNHSLTVHYVPLSRDAAVSWGSKDFKFRNNKNYYIYSC
ncbi:hypothetical protein GOM49_05830 [Clostridium bovifaecis]|uniref:YoaR-like putative peptidoglycan binding domain-containing protein n=1 Tax=Clostridium bovifaecis TaxID=2184719 RepID=A0A6I6EWU9_9CLOT|nr:hypothetical protein GOM49_05830 [Clostridium bovifaecis]